MQNIAYTLSERGLHVQGFHSPLRPNELDGLIVTEWKIGIIDDAVCQGIPRGDSTLVTTIDFGEAVDQTRISPENREALARLNRELAEAYAEAYATYHTALRIHDEWESYYIQNTDFEKADQLAQDWIQDLFSGDSRGDGEAGGSQGRHLFFGAATPRGAFDYIQRLTVGLRRRIFIKGRPGSGKSTLLKKLATAAESRGIDVQIFHCGFDPNSLDMLIFPDLSTAIFDSTSPHEYFPDREGDEVLDMYALIIKPGTDEAYAAECDAIRARYSAKMREGAAHLATAEAIDAQIKSIYTAATNFAIVDRLRLDLQTELQL